MAGGDDSSGEGCVLCAAPPVDILALLFLVQNHHAGRGLQAFFECRYPPPGSGAAQCQRKLPAPASTTRKSQLKHEAEAENRYRTVSSLSVECCFFFLSY